MKISSVIEDIIWHNQRKFCKVLLFHAWTVRAVISMTLFLCEHAIVYTVQVGLLLIGQNFVWQKSPGHQIARTSVRLTIMFGGQCWRSSVTWILSRRTSRNWSQRLRISSWDELSQDEICKSITDFRKRLQACVNAEGGHVEHLL